MTHIHLDNVSLSLPIYGHHTRSLKKVLTQKASSIKQDHDIIEVQALSHVTCSINSGEIIGLIGHNGSGKTSLLRLLAGVYEAHTGMLDTQGSIAALLDLSLGIADDLTGYENIYTTGLLKGCTPSEIKNMTPEIAQFSELDTHLSLPIRTYSSGMRIRLAFSIATAFQANILLMDEIMAVGDAKYLEKAKKRLQQMINHADIVVLASHANSFVASTCHKVLWLDHGHLKFFGPTEEGLAMYQEHIQT